MTRELSRQVEGALARVQYNQLASLPQEDGSRQVWQFDLPVRHGERLDGFHLQVEEEQRDNGAAGEDSAWTVNLAFSLEPLGPVRVRIGLLGETVSSTFWAERESTARLIGGRLEELRQGFERVGLEVGQLSARQGLPAAPRTLRHTTPLVDEQA
jgi:hypothetical protein